MKRAIQKSLLQYVIRHRNGYLFLACGSLALNILLSIGLISMFGHEKVILIPPRVTQSFWVSNSEVSPEYLSEMSLFFADLRFNITPSNIENQREILLRYVSSEYYESLKMQLISESEHIATDHISTAFYPIDIQVDNKHLAALVTGDLVSTVGTNQLPSQHVIYKIQYKYHSGRLLVKSFEEVKSHA